MDGKLVQSALDVMRCGDQEPVPIRTAQLHGDVDGGESQSSIRFAVAQRRATSVRPRKGKG